MDNKEVGEDLVYNEGIGKREYIIGTYSSTEKWDVWEVFTIKPM